jgi:hypothetical protein
MSKGVGMIMLHYVLRMTKEAGNALIFENDYSAIQPPPYVELQIEECVPARGYVVQLHLAASIRIRSASHMKLVCTRPSSGMPNH